MVKIDHPTCADDKPIVSVVIVNNNGKEFLEQCLHSVLHSYYTNFEVILVDNASTDGSVEKAEKMLENNCLIRIRNKNNVGPAVARNMGVKAAKGKLIAFLDNDTKVDAFWLSNAVHVLESDHSIGAAQLKLLLMGDPYRFDYGGDYLSPYGFLVQRVDEGAIDDGRFDELVEIFSVKEAGMIIRRDLFEELGGFDEDYFMYVEGMDLCWRVWLMGYKVLFIPTSRVYHAFGRISKLKSPRTKFLSKYHGTKNYITTLLKNLSMQNLFKILPLHIILWLGVIIWHILRRRTTEAMWIVKAILWNLTHFKRTWAKRQTVQFRLRKVSDASIMSRVMKKEHLTYFCNKITHPTSGWKI